MILNRKLVLQDLVRTPDGAGGYIETWTDLGAVWADVRAKAGREGETDHTRLSRTSYDISLRSAPFGSPSRPKPEQRFVEGSRVFRIHAVIEKDPQSRLLKCLATEEFAT